MKKTNQKSRTFAVTKYACVLSLLGATSCIGKLGDAVGDGPGDGPVVTSSGDLKCDPTLVPDALPLRRLSKVQYQNTVRDLVALAVPSNAEAVIGAIEPRFDGYPDDLAKGPDDHFAAFHRLDQTIHQEHVDAAYAIGVEIGTLLTSPDNIDAVIGSCATDADAGNDDDCLDELIERFAPLALRRPLEDDDVSFYRQVAGDAPFEAADYGDVIGQFFSAPYFFYMVEHGTDEAAELPDVYRLGSYELASRLSYHFWQTMPDEALFAAAASGELLTPEGYEAQVQRLYADPRTGQSIQTFYEEWLHRGDLDELDSRLGTPVFDAFADGFVPGPDLRERMLAELGDLGRYYSHDVEGTFEDLFTSRRSFARTEDLASLYGVAPWTSGEPPELPDAARVGLLTRAGLLATGSANTRPIMKGVFIRKAILCDQIPPPPANANAVPPDLSPDLTTREVVEQLTEQEGTTCAGCHTSRINHLGYATEDFDALGRHRTVQKLYHLETGALLGDKPIDTFSIPQVVPGDMAESTGAADLSQQIVESGLAHSCFARVYFRYTFGREEDLDKDGCSLVPLREKLVEGSSLSEVLRQIALLPSFQERAYEL